MSRSQVPQYVIDLVTLFPQAGFDREPQGNVVRNALARNANLHGLVAAGMLWLSAGNLCIVALAGILMAAGAGDVIDPRLAGHVRAAPKGFALANMTCPIASALVFGLCL